VAKKMMRNRLMISFGLFMLAAVTAQAAPYADTKAWWALTGQLSDDAMEGRDTGTPAYQRATDLVAARFKAAGLKPAGESDSYFQHIEFHETRVETDGTSFALIRTDGEQKLKFLHEISIRPADGMPADIEGALSFRGYCSAAEMGSDMAGKIAVCFGGRRAGVPNAAERLAAASKAGAIGLINVDDPGFTIEPPRWPDAYARTVRFREDAIPAPGLPVMRLKADTLAAVIAGTDQSAAAILTEGAASRPLPAFDIPARLKAHLSLTTRETGSPNILGLLPGTDPVLRDQIVVVSAHLDGYGYGEPVNGDALYNGAFDDAAYVATLVRLADGRKGHGFKRSLLFAAFTGEEKGLLGANYFVRHPTVPREHLAANINLDQIRPLFPLKILTMHGLNDTTLGALTQKIAAKRGIEIRPDLEPERNLTQRADHWPFLKSGVPATGFVFGYDPGTDAERRYREWYQIRYHRPQDDMSQPIDMQAAQDFNRFFYALTEAVATVSERPAFLPTSPLKPR
jgi:Zn-dependent M28 family amino/carboxypeptidase